MPKFTIILASLVLGGLTASAGAEAAGKLKTRGPVQCRGNQDIVLSNVKIVSKIAVNAHGSCDIVIRNSHIEGSIKAVDAHGSSNVRIVNSVVRSRGLALHVHGSTDVHLKNTRVEGRIRKHGNGDLSDEGGNHYRRGKPGAKPSKPSKPAKPAKPAKPPAGKLKPRSPLTCANGQVRTLSRVSIDTSRTAIDVRGGCTLVIRDSVIKAGNTGLRVSGGGTVRIFGSTIRGKKHALDMSGGATVYAKSTKFQGNIRQSIGSVLVRN